MNCCRPLGHDDEIVPTGLETSNEETNDQSEFERHGLHRSGSEPFDLRLKAYCLANNLIKIFIWGMGTITRRASMVC